MEKETISIVVSGEVDHGKSTLIGRLLLETKSLPPEKLEQVKSGMALAFLTDQLEEERDQERTIDTTQAFFQTKKRRYCLVDTPGHLEFIKNMITGATRADAALVIIDAQAGLTEQARRHISVLGLVGFRRVLVAINKMDLAGYSEKIFLEARKDVLECLRRTNLVADSVIPISAEKGDNVAARSRALRWHAGPVLLERLDALRVPRRMDSGALRLAVQDVYSLGAERIAVGRVESGRLRLYQPVVLMPGKRKVKVVAFKAFEKKKKVFVAGENAGLILEDPVRVKRGDIICGSGSLPAARRCFEGNVFWFSGKPPKAGAAMTLRCATQVTRCEVKCRRSSGPLVLNQVACVSIKAAAPVVVESIDVSGGLGRFVLERQGIVCGAGIILPS